MVTRVYAIGGEISSLEKLTKFLKFPSCDVQLIWDNKKPDIVFTNSSIYNEEIAFQQMCRFLSMKGRPVTVYVGSECGSPDFNVFDYAITNEHIFDTDRVIRLPVVYLYGGDNFINDLTYAEALRLAKRRQKFCNFIYSNGLAHPMRDKIFYKISEYKWVDSLGAHLNNVKSKPTRTCANWQQLSIQQKSEYKFSIASENAVYDGYVTEKIITSLQAHTVPIYWGDPAIDKEFNPKAFINVSDYETLDDLNERIAEINSSDEIWARLVSEPWQTSEQLLRQNECILKYNDSICKLLSCIGNQSYRCPVGCRADMYNKWFKRRFKQETRFERMAHHPLLIKERLAFNLQEYRTKYRE